MARSICAALALVCFVSTASASRERPKPAERIVPKLPTRSLRIAPDGMEVPPPAQAQLTEKTEVFLDGKKCSYRDVPPSAVIADLLLDEDGATILRIEFSSRK